MSELQGLIAVHIIDDVAVEGLVKELNCIGAVVVVASHKDKYIGSYLSDALYALLGNHVPLVYELGIGYFIEQLERCIGSK